MTIVNESVRLFFAIFALILVGMLSAPMGSELVSAPVTSARSVASVSAKSPLVKATVKAKASPKKLTKIAKASRKIARRG